MVRRLLLALEVLLVLLLLLSGIALRARVGSDWTFSGADGYAYMGAAMELREHHRYAIRPPPWFPQGGDVPLGYCRLPGYPLLLAAVAPLEVPLTYGGLAARVKPVQHALDLLTCLLVYGLARRLGGRLAGLLGLALTCLHPTLILYANAALTETLATFLTTGVLCLLGAALLGREGRRGALVVLAGVAAGLTALVRLDGLVLFPCLLLPALLGRGRASLRLRLRPALLALGVACLCFAPWPLRNHLRFGVPRLGGVCNIRGDAMSHTAFLGWFSTWVERETQTPDTLYCFFRPGCVPWIGVFPKEAFDSPAERRGVQGLFLRMEREGMSAAVDSGFQHLTRTRIVRRPLRSLLALPAVRAYHLWTDASDQPLRAGAAPWPEMTAKVVPWLRVVSVATACLGLLGLLALVLRRAERPLGALFFACIALRTAFLALIGFVDNRYVLELTPLCLALGAMALGRGAMALGRGARALLGRAAQRLRLHDELVGQRPGP